MEVTLPNYSYIFNFEETFSQHETKQWMMKNWTNGFYYCGLYMILIFGGQHYMASRPRFELRGILCLWNTLLASFSIIGFTRTAPELIHVLKHHGLLHSICIPRLVLFIVLSFIKSPNLFVIINFAFQIQCQKLILKVDIDRHLLLIFFSKLS